MADDPIDAVYSYVERAYVRLQAGDILIRCLEEGNASPMQQMVESLVLAGPQSLAVLREMRSEAGQRKSQVLDDLHQVYSDLENSLRSFGVVLTDKINAESVTQLKADKFLGIMREQGLLDDETQVSCLQILRDSREIITSLALHVELLEDIEIYLQDWLWGLAYQLARNGFGESDYLSSNVQL